MSILDGFLSTHSDNPMVIKRLETIGELQQLVTVFTLAFESTYDTSEEYLVSVLKNSSSVVLGVFEEARIIGGVVAFVMTPIHGTRELYIYDIAVEPEFQRQGIGKQIMEALKQEARVRDVGTIFVEAESEDAGAVKFYRAIGGEEVAVNHFNFKV